MKIALVSSLVFVVTACATSGSWIDEPKNSMFYVEAWQSGSCSIFQSEKDCLADNKPAAKAKAEAACKAQGRKLQSIDDGRVRTMTGFQDTKGGKYLAKCE